MQSKAMVDSSGTVFWPPPAKLRSTCKIDITYFPFDDQVCTMKFGSWTYDDGSYKNRSLGGSEFQTVYPISPVPYPDIKFHIVIQRRTLYYLFNIIFPCLWLTVLSLLGFWLPPDSGEKITLGITVLLAFSVFMLLIAENMPATSEFVPLIGIYLTVTMSTTSLSIVLTVFVLHLHHVGPNDRPVPRQLRSLLFNRLAPLLCMSSVARYQRKAGRRRQRYEESRREVAAAADAAQTEASNGSGGGVEGKSTTMEADKRYRQYDRMQRHLRYLMRKQAEDEAAQLLINDWRMLAFIVDRMLFWLFLVAASASTLIILVIMPLFKEVVVDAFVFATRHVIIDFVDHGEHILLPSVLMKHPAEAADEPGAAVGHAEALLARQGGVGHDEASSSRSVVRDDCRAGAPIRGSSHTNMAQALQLTAPDAFDIDSDPLTRAQRWKTWARRFNSYIRAAGITDATQQLELLVYTAGEKLEDFMEDNSVQKGKSTNELIQKLQEIFDQKNSVVFLRYQFETCRQEEGESIDAWYHRLRKAADQCEFGELRDSLIRDKVVAHYRSEKIRRELLQLNDICLADVLKRIRAREAAEQQAQAMEENSSGGAAAMTTANVAALGPPRARPSQPFRRDPAMKDGGISCERCGRPGHRTCEAARDKACRRCGKIGHFARACRGTSRIPVRAVNEPDDRSYGQVEYLQDNSTEHELFSLRNSGSAWTQATVNGFKTTLLIDSGAACNIIDREAFERMPQKARLQAASDRVYPYGSQQPLKLLGKTDLQVSVFGCQETLPFLVLDGKGACIIGRRSAEDLGVLRVGPEDKAACELRSECPTDRLLAGVPKDLRQSPGAPSLDEILKENAQAFDGIGCLKNYAARIFLEEGARPECRHLLTFSTPRGLRRLTRLCMGLSTAQEILQAVMSSVLAGLSKVKWIHDDIIVYGHSVAEHHNNLRECLQRLAQHGLTLNPAKCKLARTQAAVPNALSLTSVQNSSQKDATIQAAIRALETGRWSLESAELRSLHALRHELSAVDGVLLRGQRIIVPVALRRLVLDLAHRGHQCTRKTLDRLNTKVWWPRMQLETERFIATCRACLATSHAADRTTGRAPAELLMGRVLNDSIPSVRPSRPVAIADRQLRQRDALRKAQGKLYTDRKRLARPHKLKVGDTVLRRRLNPLKGDTPFEWDPWLIEEIKADSATIRQGARVCRRHCTDLKRVAPESEPDNLGELAAMPQPEVNAPPPQPAAGERAASPIALRPHPRAAKVNVNYKA
uniref:CCHC-type domain-containing protein n=1 Tax=Macrostomum lignano TaxID=282301 RepID=A0A1I8I1A9_9PLAT